MHRRNSYYFLLFLFLSFTTTGCKKSKSVLSNYNINCELLTIDFEVEPKGYREIEDELNDYLSSTYSFDIFYARIEGGSDNFILQRFIVEEMDTKLKTLTITPTTQNEQSKDLPNDFYDLIQKFEEGSFLQTCQFLSRSDSYLILIKQESLVKFKYSSVNADYKFLNQKDKDKMAHTIKLIEYLKNEF